MASLALGGALAGAPTEAEATDRFANLEARLAATQADRERSARTINLSRENMNDILHQTSEVDNTLVFVDTDGVKRYVVDGDGNELFPTPQRNIFEVSVEGTRYQVSELSSIEGTIYAIPDGFERILERNEGVLVPSIDMSLDPVTITVSPNITALERVAYLTEHQGTAMYASKDTGAPVQLQDSIGSTLYPDGHGRFTMSFRGNQLRVTSLTEHAGNIYAVPEGYVLDIVVGQEPAIRTRAEQEERRNNVQFDFSQQDNDNSIGPTASR